MRTILIALTVADDDAEDAMRAIDKLLDNGGIQDPIVEYVADMYGGELEIVEASATYAPDTAPDAENAAVSTCGRCGSEYTGGCCARCA